MSALLRAKQHLLVAKSIALTPRLQRGYATLKDVQLRLKAIKNIGKITNSMKMIASTRLNRAQKSILKYLNNTEEKDYVSSAQDDDWYKKLNIHKGTPSLVIACSSDRGLCGSIHSSVSKVVKRIAREDKSEHGTQIAILGEKAKSQIAREARKAITIHFSNVGKTIPTMSDAVSIWNTIRICSTTPKLESGDAEKSPATSKDEPNKQLMIVYNRFVSMISFETVIVPIDRGIGLIAEDPPVVIESKYEGVSGLYKDFAEYLTVSRLFCALVEGHVTELISKRGAMENATKNSEEMVATLTMKYNRTRQAVITNELVDIIVGASAL